MAKRKSPDDISGSTFADLYDVQEEFTRRGVKPMGRPKNKIQRKPTTVYLTKEETTMLRRLHLMVGEHISSINKSQIIGMSIELLAELIADHNEDGSLLKDTRSLDNLKRKLKNILML